MEELLIGERLLPIQYAALFQGRARSFGESVALAVLEQAVSDLRRYRFAKHSREKRLYRDAYKWIDSNNRMWVYSFVNICEVLGLNPVAVRSRLLRNQAETSPPLTAAA